jgi:hypothetical protein
MIAKISHRNALRCTLWNEISYLNGARAIQGGVLKPNHVSVGNDARCRMVNDGMDHDECHLTSPATK